MILPVLIAMVAGWIHRHQHHVITYLKEENRVLKSKLPSGRLRLSDNERRALAALAYPLGRQQLKDTAIIATPDTLLRWYKRLIADKFDGSTKRKRPGPPRVPEEVEHLVLRMAEKTPRGAIGVSRVHWPISGIPLTKSRCGTFCAVITSILLRNDARQA